MNCKNLKIRSKNYKKYFYCSLCKQEVDIKKCKHCEFKEYKTVKRIRGKKHKQTKATEISKIVKEIPITIEIKTNKSKTIIAIKPLLFSIYLS